jgi:GldM C-terminal domain
MKKNLLLFFCSIFYFSSFSQSFSIANEKMSVFYAGVENPISFAVEKIATKLLIVKTNNGIIKKVLNDYMVVPSSIGTAEISLYKKVSGKEILVAKKEFRVKKMTNPIFKIGSGRKKIPMEEIANQNYVRGESEGIDFDANNVEIETFKVTINFKDTTIAPISFTNDSNKIKDEIKQKFFSLKSDDVVVFSEIYVNAPWGKHEALEDVYITIF